LHAEHPRASSGLFITVRALECFCTVTGHCELLFIVTHLLPGLPVPSYTALYLTNMYVTDNVVTDQKSIAVLEEKNDW
jgi:hypothetical protein